MLQNNGFAAMIVVLTAVAVVTTQRDRRDYW